MQRQRSGVAVAVNGSATACKARLRGLDVAAQAAFAPRSRGLMNFEQLIGYTGPDLATEANVVQESGRVLSKIAKKLVDFAAQSG